MGLLIDSTAFVHAERRGQTPEELVHGLIDRFGDVDLAISVMSAGELFHGCWRASSPARRSRRKEFVEAVLSAIPAVPVSLVVMRIFAEIDAHLSAVGKRIATSDLLIASTALSRGDEVATGNVRHFRRVPQLVVHELE